MGFVICNCSNRHFLNKSFTKSTFYKKYDINFVVFVVCGLKTIIM